MKIKEEKLNYFALKLETVARETETQVINAVNASGLANLCYSYKTRVKSEEKLLEKRTRKQTQGKSTYCLNQITDVLGIRFMSLFRVQLADIFEQLLSLIQHTHELNPNPFKKRALKEVIVHSVNPDHDEVSAQIKRIAKKKGVDLSIFKVEKTKDYTSIHIVTETNNKIDFEGLDDYFLPLEIQIRTVFEDAWGEIDHRYGYVQRSGKSAGEVVHNSEFVVQHLSALKKFTDACAEYADCIYKEAKNDIACSLIYGKILSVPDKSFIEELEKSSIDKELLLEYKRLKQIRRTAEESTTNNISYYTQAADGFLQLSEQIDQSDTNGIESTFYFYTKLNEAACLLSSKNHDRVYTAVNIYKTLGVSYPDVPILFFRLGQAYGKLGKISKSLKVLRKAKKLITKTEKDSISRQADIDHVKTHLPSILGFQLWKKFNSSTDNKLSLINEAIDETRVALNFGDTKLLAQANNNILYYLVDKAQLLRSAAEPIDEKLKSEMNACLSYLLQHNSPEESTEMDYIDTIAKTYYFMEEYNKMEPYLNKLLELVFKSEYNGDHDSSTLLEIVHNAYEMQKKIPLAR